MSEAVQEWKSGAPQVSVIVLNCNYPHNITRLLPSLQKTSGVSYETVVVDNGSTPDVVALLQHYQEQGFMDKLVLNPVNHYFSEGNNIGVRNSNPNSEFILLLNNDTEIVDGIWLHRMVEWAEGIPKTLLAYTWSDHPTCPKDERRGIVSIDWQYNMNVPGYVAPEGWCCLIRREAWREMSPDFPFLYGILEMLASIVRDGHPCGVLSQYGRYIVHYHGGSHGSIPRNFGANYVRQPDQRTWWSGLSCESLDFTLGPHERQSYMEW